MKDQNDIATQLDGANLWSIPNQECTVEENPFDACAKPMKNDIIVRTYSAGVHIGKLVWQNGKEVKLSNARRLWRWSGAFTLNQVAAKGVNRDNSRISCIVPWVTLTEAIEIIPVAEGVDLSPCQEDPE